MLLELDARAPEGGGEPLLMRDDHDLRGRGRLLHERGEGCDQIDVQAALVTAGGALLLAGYGAALATAPAVAGRPYLSTVLTAEDHSSGLWEVIGSGGFALATIGVCLLLCRTPLRWVAVPLRAVGSMPLTAYVLQLVVWALVALALLGDTGDLYGIREAGLFLPLTLGLIAGCTVWALTLGRGPLEWLIDLVVRLVVGRDAVDAGGPRIAVGGVAGPRSGDGSGGPGAGSGSGSALSSQGRRSWSGSPDAIMSAITSSPRPPRRP